MVKYFTLVLFFTLSLNAMELFELEELFQSFQSIHSETLSREYNAKLLFNPPPKGMDSSFWWNIPDASARFVFIDNLEPKEISIFVFGGLARVEGMSKDSMAISLCHELGHLLAGPPLKHNGSSLEGAADSYSTGECLRSYFRMVKNSTLRQPNPIEIRKCEEYFKEAEEIEICLRSFAALDGQLNFLRLKSPNLAFWDESEFIATHLRAEDYYYPDSACRLESMRNSILNLPAPVCWKPK